MIYHEEHDETHEPDGIYCIIRGCNNKPEHKVTPDTKESICDDHFEEFYGSEQDN